MADDAIFEIDEVSARGRVVSAQFGDVDGDDGPLARRAARQEPSTTGVIRVADFDADGLPDFLLCD